MKRFRSILFVVNEENLSETAFRRAFDRAAINDARLTVVSVADAPGPELRWVSKLISPSKYVENVREERLSRLRNLVEPVTGKGVPIELKLLEGNVFLEVVRQVLRADHDLVIKPADTWTAATPGMFTSTDMHLMRKCPCPLWIMKPGSSERYDRILAAVDPYAETAEENQLAKLITDLSTSLAMSEQAELHIVHAWQLPSESTLRYGRGALPADEVDKLAKEARLEHEGALNDLLNQYPLDEIGAHVHLAKGMPAEVIRDQVKENRADLVIMGTVGRTGIPGFFIGNTAEGILTQVDCSVLAVKPAGFESPVKLA